MTAPKLVLSDDQWRERLTPEEFAVLLERRGAEVMQAPTIRILPLVDDTELERVTEELIAHPPEVMVATTGIGFRGWVEAADGWGNAEAVLRALSESRLIARGPKAKGAIRAAGLREEWSPESESSSEVLDRLLDEEPEDDPPGGGEEPDGGEPEGGDQLDDGPGEAPDADPSDQPPGPTSSGDQPQTGPQSSADPAPDPPDEATEAPETPPTGAQPTPTGTATASAPAAAE